MKIKPNLSLILLCFLLFSACSAPEPEPTPIPLTNIPTNTPEPTETSTEVPTNTPEPTATNTPTLEPTATNTPTSTPIPTDTPEPTSTPQTINGPHVFEGNGDDILIPDLDFNLWLIKFDSPSNSGNLALTPFDADGERMTLLVNEIGPYSGWHFSANQVGAFEIKSDADWTLTAYEWNNAAVQELGLKIEEDGSYSGFGDSVITIVNGDTGALTSGLKEAQIDYTGESNFIVVSFGLYGGDVLVNDIGSYSGGVLVPEDTILFVVRSSGDWTVDLSE